MLSWRVLGCFHRTAGGPGGVTGGPPQVTKHIPKVLVASLLSVDNIPPPQTPRSTRDPWQFPYMEPWPISVVIRVSVTGPLKIGLRINLLTWWG